MKSTAADPFGERIVASLRARLSVLGGDFVVESSDESALRLAVDAFGGLPRHRVEPEPRRFRVRLVLTEHRAAWPRRTGPPPPTLTAGGGLLCATIDAGNFVIVDAERSTALVALSPAMLRHPYNARYELIELAIVTLASRAQPLVPLHAACIGASGKGLLLMGSSGAGKSTLALHALANGLQLLSEDSAFVALDPLRVTGTPNYVHVLPGALGFLPFGELRERIRRSPTIRRRSGAEKHEVDLRRLTGKAPAAPLRLAASVFLSTRAAGSRDALNPLGRRALLERLEREQPYATGLPNWPRFEKQIAKLPAYELRRTAHPDLAIRRLQALLAELRTPR